MNSVNCHTSLWLFESQLSCHVDALMLHFLDCRYASHTVDNYLAGLTHFAHWISQCKIEVKKKSDLNASVLVFLSASEIQICDRGNFGFAQYLVGFRIFLTSCRMLPILSLEGSGGFNPLGNSISGWKDVNHLVIKGSSTAVGLSLFILFNISAKIAIMTQIFLPNRLQPLLFPTTLTIIPL